MPADFQSWGIPGRLVNLVQGARVVGVGTLEVGDAFLQRLLGLLQAGGGVLGGLGDIFGQALPGEADLEEAGGLEELLVAAHGVGARQLGLGTDAGRGAGGELRREERGRTWSGWRASAGEDI